MIDVIKNIGHFSFRLPDELSGLDGKDRAVMLDDVVDILEEYQREQSQAGKWIPCEEALPSVENEDYLICTNKGHIRILLWTKCGWNTFIDSKGKYHTGAEIKNVIAWGFLPQPYKKEGAE